MSDIRMDRKMKYAISNIAWQSSEDDSIYSLMKAFGFDGLEIAPAKFFSHPYTVSKQKIENKKSELTSKGIHVVSMQALLFGTTGLSLFDSTDSRNNLLEYLKTAVDFAACIGARNLVFGSPKNRVIPDDMPHDIAEEIAVVFFRSIGEYSRSHSVVFTIEPNPPAYGGNFITTTAEAIGLVKKVDSDGFKLNLDLSTMTLNHEDYRETFEAALPVANHIHVSEPFLKPIPQAGTDHETFSAMLAASGYTKCISIEMNRPSEEHGKKMRSDYEHVKRTMEFFDNTYRRH